RCCCWWYSGGADSLDRANNNNDSASSIMIKTITLGVTLASVLISGQAGAVELPDPASVRTDRLQLMQGFPPAAEKQITQASFMRPYPNPRWSFHHAREFFPSRRRSEERRVGKERS